MTAMDGLALAVIVLVMLLSAGQGFLRTLVMGLALYGVTLVVGAIALSYTLLFEMLAGLLPWLGLQRPPMLSYQAMVFLGIGLPMFVTAWVLMTTVLGDTRLPTLGPVEGLAATIAGAALGIVLAALLCNVWGILVLSPWRDLRLWYVMRTAYSGALFRPYLNLALAVFRWTLFPFQLSQVPAFLVPQL